MEMFKEYVSPEMEIILVEDNDIVTTSGNIGGEVIVAPDPFGNGGNSVDGSSFE